MKVQDLIDELKSYDGEAEVHFSYGYGDYWRTQVAPRVSQVFVGPVEYSEYHRMDKLVEEDYDDEDGCGDDVQQTRQVVIIG